METIGYNHLCLLQEEASLVPVPDNYPFLDFNYVSGIALAGTVLVALFTGVSPVQAARILRYENYGEDVVTLQNQLKSLGCFPNDVYSTGYFGSITQNAVRRLQHIQGFAVDGVVGDQTHDAIAQRRGCQLYRTLRFGDQGADVWYLQAQLNTWGFPLNPETPIELGSHRFLIRFLGRQVRYISTRKGV